MSEESPLCDVADNNKEKKRELSFDEILPYVGEFGRFQIILLSMFCFALTPMTFHTLIMYFAALNPAWECVPGDSICTTNGTFLADNNARCSMPRESWRYTQPETYSIVTQFDLYCSREWAIHLTTSIFFVGWTVSIYFIMLKPLNGF